MKRRDFLIKGALAASTASLSGAFRGENNVEVQVDGWCRDKAKNIIFLVSDGMSTGTLQMADTLMRRKLGKESTWLRLYREKRVSRGLMDTASASSLVTDSAAASSSWGGGVRVPNGSLNIGANGEEYTPILQKFKAAGKSVGCVTTVPITHATPAGFCVNMKSRNQQVDIALAYKSLRFDVMMGGGNEFFNQQNRGDGRDLYAEFAADGIQVIKDRQAMMAANEKMPVLGVFTNSGLPYTVDHQSDPLLEATVPSLAEMTVKAIEIMRHNKKGFVLQVEGGKVDWAAHANDPAGLLYDQMAFDEAVSEAIQFAEKDKNTLVVITTDHGNGNPGLMYGSHADRNFDRFFNVTQSNTWLLENIKRGDHIRDVRDKIEAVWKIEIKHDEAALIHKPYNEIKMNGEYADIQMPFRGLAELQEKYFSVGWASMVHTGDYVELAAFGPGMDLFPPHLLNTDVHHILLKAAGVESKT